MVVLQWAIFCVFLLATNARAHTPDIHYRQGLRELEDGHLETATEEFKRARTLNQKFAPAYVGLALVEMEKGNYAGAFEMLKQGRKYDKKLVDVYVARSRVYAREGKKNWVKKALKELKQAEKIRGGDDRIAYYRGVVYRQAGKFQEAVQAFGTAAGMKGPMAEKSERAQEQVQLIQRALLGVKRSGRAVALKGVVTRADMALLFLDEFDLRGWLKRYRPDEVDTRFKAYYPGVAEEASPGPPEPNDVADRPDKNLILDVVAMEIPGLELYPDGRFGPKRPVTRAEFAQIMQGLVVVGMRDRDLATKYFGEASRFSDMRADHFAYNAAVLCIQRGLIEPRADGRFWPDEPVSGAQAILGIKKALGM